jgi:(1->4)-alpha-D-glucan 1-alpha-D-glucosylmutase
MLADLRAQDDADIYRLVQDLLSTRVDGKIRLFLIYRALKAKKAHREIFRSGAYLALNSARRFRNHVIAFAWRYQRQWALVIAPRFLSHLIQEGDLPLGEQVWQDTEVIMPNGAPTVWRSVITSEVLSASQTLAVGDILLSFPVALLMGEGKEKFVQVT